MQEPPTPPVTETPEVKVIIEPEPPLGKPLEKGQWIVGKVVSFLSQLSENLGSFFGENQQLLINLGLIFGAIIAFRVSLAVIAAINEIPLVAPTFELVGIGYSIWFISRFLLNTSNRQELGQKIQGFLDK
ncbi:CAAD domain-containing protein [Synechocystis sp. PCC 7509]|uniref:CAAD domain-containing protein n=1 Tax=Synechocystis sp. PCC 7509 TaxID=927677 RepID=UPI0002AC8E1F|nr:CAAD domain-containing protein [Synechocystis sp. PCC 7509]